MKYNRGLYGTFLYGGTTYPANYTETVKPTTDYTLQPRPTTGWGIGHYHTYGLEYDKTTRIVYGDYVAYIPPEVNYKFIQKTDFSSDY